MSSILVIGDIILDKYIICDPVKLSQEAPIPVFSVISEFSTLGGAANVAQNVRSMGGSSILAGIIGFSDRHEINDLLKYHNLDRAILPCTDRITTKKTRVVAYGSQQVCRYDNETATRMSRPYEEQFVSMLHGILTCEDISIIVISDYAKGCITPGVINYLQNYKDSKQIIVDPKVSDLSYYGDVTIITPNASEFHRSILYSKEWFSKYTIVTRGADGMDIYFEGLKKNIPSRNVRKVRDVTGAGDTVVAALAVYLDRHEEYEIEDAARFANNAAAVAVGGLGTIAVTMDDINALALPGLSWRDGD